MLNFNVETHGDIRFCTICRRYIVMKANSPQQVPTPCIRNSRCTVVRTHHGRPGEKFARSRHTATRDSPTLVTADTGQRDRATRETESPERREPIDIEVSYRALVEQQALLELRCYTEVACCEKLVVRLQARVACRGEIQMHA